MWIDIINAAQHNLAFARNLYLHTNAVYELNTVTDRVEAHKKAISVDVEMLFFLFPLKKEKQTHWKILRQYR